MKLIGHGIGGVNILDVVVVQFDISSQRQGIGCSQVLLVSLVVQLIALFTEGHHLVLRCKKKSDERIATTTTQYNYYILRLY